jgi:DNA invertase Pin-like site-specific DNA recombinase
VRRIGFASTATGASRLSEALSADEPPFDEIVVGDGVALGGLRPDPLPAMSPGDEVVVPQLDDLGASLDEVLLTLGRARRRRVSIHVVGMAFRTGDGQAPAIVRALRAAAEFQDRLASRRWAREIEAARQGGAFRTGRPRKVSLAAVADLRARGLGAAEIARRLNVSRWTVYRKIAELRRAAAR